jgi:hypothetical protein
VQPFGAPLYGASTKGDVVRLGITGHRGLRPEVEKQVRERLDELVDGCSPGELTAVSCVADGPDSWFAQAVLAQGGRLEAVVPATDYRAVLPEWHQAAYDELLGRAAETHHTGLDESTPQAYQVGGEVLVGLVDELIAVWDGAPARGYGGTADAVAYALRVGVPVRRIWPKDATRD